MKKILIVDDDEPVVELLQDILSAVPDWETSVAYDATMALDAVERAKPDVVLLDIQLYGIDGIQLYDTWKESPRTRDIPMLFITANAGRHREQFEERGVTDYIEKPFDIDCVIGRVNSALGESRQPAASR